MDYKELVDILERGNTVGYKKEQLDKIAGQMSDERNLEFSKYVTRVFTTALKTPPIAEMVNRWNSLSGDEKITFTQNITNTFLDIIISDIDNGNVTIYKADGIVMGDEISPEARALFRQDIHAPKIKVGTMTSRQMGVSKTGNLDINFDFLMYKLQDCFLMDLRHELAHVIDIFIPEISPIPPEVRKTALRNYVQPEDGKEYYIDNPIELNAQTDRFGYATQIRQTIKEIKAGETIVLPKHVRPTGRTAVLMEILNDVHNDAKRHIENNRAQLPESLYEGATNKNDFINQIINDLDEKKKKLIKSMGLYMAGSYNLWKSKVADEYMSSVFVTMPERHNSFGHGAKKLKDVTPDNPQNSGIKITKETQRY